MLICIDRGIESQIENLTSLSSLISFRPKRLCCVMSLVEDDVQFFRGTFCTYTLGLDHKIERI